MAAAHAAAPFTTTTHDRSSSSCSIHNITQYRSPSSCSIHNNTNTVPQLIRLFHSQPQLIQLLHSQHNTVPQLHQLLHSQQQHNRHDRSSSSCSILNNNTRLSPRQGLDFELFKLCKSKLILYKLVIFMFSYKVERLGGVWLEECCSF